MNSKSSALLMIVTTVATLVTLTFVCAGAGLAGLLLVVSLLGLVAWLRIPLLDGVERTAIIPYLLVVVASLLLDGVRYWAGYAEHIGEYLPGLFTPHFVSGNIVWFLSAVSLPVILMLAGGYALLRGHSIGRYLAWWTALFGMADGIGQLAVEFLTGPYEHHYYLGALLALLEIAAGAWTWLRLVDRSPVADATDAAAARLSPAAINLWTVAFVAFGAVYGIMLFNQAGIIPVAIIVGSMIIGLFAWRITAASFPTNRLKAVPLYLLMMALFYLHVGEEVLTSFNQAIAALSGKPWSDVEFALFIGLFGPALWIAGALGLWLRQPWGDFLVWFMTVGMILGEPTHYLAFPVVAMFKFGIGYTYFPGMVTALFPMIPAIMLVATALKDYRANVASAPRAPSAASGLTVSRPA